MRDANYHQVTKGYHNLHAYMYVNMNKCHKCQHVVKYLDHQNVS